MKLHQCADDALAHLLRHLRDADYRFVTPTPATHQRAIGRPGWERARDLRGVFGWSLPFAPDLLPSELLDRLSGAELLERQGDALQSKVRVSSLAGRLFVHSAFPTEAEDSVFFGPDSYRFVRFLEQELPKLKPGRLVDMGAGGGVGGIMSASICPGCEVVLLEVNPVALRLARINAEAASVEVALIEGGSLEDVPGRIDLVIANPPYIIDENDRTYRNGGGMHGGRVSLDWALDAARRISPGGAILLYTGSAIVRGTDALCASLEDALPALGCTLDYREIDPDVFGEELDKPVYAEVERIAAIGAVITKG